MSKTVRIIISGSREYENYNEFCKSLDLIILDILNKNGMTSNNDKVEIVTGMAVGTDLMAIRYVYETKYHVNSVILDLKGFEPKFWIHGEMAGEIRNKEMAEYVTSFGEDPYYLYAFWNGNPGGTKHMIDTAAQYGIPTYIKRIDEVSDV